MTDCLPPYSNILQFKIVNQILKLLDPQTVHLIQPPLQPVPLLRAELYQADVEVLQVLQVLLQQQHVVLQEDALLHGLLAAAVPPGDAPPGGGVRQVPPSPSTSPSPSASPSPSPSPSHSPPLTPSPPGAWPATWRRPPRKGSPAGTERGHRTLDTGHWTSLSIKWEWQHQSMCLKQ